MRLDIFIFGYISVQALSALDPVTPSRKSVTFVRFCVNLRAVLSAFYSLVYFPVYYSAFFRSIIHIYIFYLFKLCGYCFIFRYVLLYPLSALCSVTPSRKSVTFVRFCVNLRAVLSAFYSLVYFPVYYSAFFRSIIHIYIFYLFKLCGYCFIFRYVLLYPLSALCSVTPSRKSVTFVRFCVDLCAILSAFYTLVYFSVNYSALFRYVFNVEHFFTASEKSYKK